MTVEIFISYNLSTKEINFIIAVKVLLLELQEYYIDEFLGYNTDRFLDVLQEILDNDDTDLR